MKRTKVESASRRSRARESGPFFLPSAATNTAAGGGPGLSGERTLAQAKASTQEIVDGLRHHGSMDTRLDHVRANVADLRRAVEWYTTMLGFEVDSTWPPDRPNYAHFKSAGGATFAVMEAEGRGARFNFTVADPDALWVELKDRVAVVEPLFDTPYGTRKFTIADPDGNELGFVRDPTA
jgi:catechol 2,3-dioxygenase-like lactoylglutathione lyase family enzyme